MKHSVSAVVPVFNEEKTVKDIVKVLMSSHLIKEVICVNDCSRDKSMHILKSFGKKIVFIDLKKNRGKGYAMSLGIKRAKGDIIIFIDSDMKGLTKKHVKTLVKPIVSGNHVFGVIGVFKDNVPAPVAKRLQPLSGQRAYFRKELLPHLERMKKTRRGVETYFNSAFRSKKVVYVNLQGLRHAHKIEKSGFISGILDYIVQGVEIIKALLNK